MGSKDNQTHFSDHIFNDELKEISRSRKARGVDDSKIDDPSKTDDPPRSPSSKLGLTGLALSGGGIRSATFSLGVIQGLVNKGKFKCMDYLSTVSGGGYLGACISSVLSKPGASAEDHFADKYGSDDTGTVTHLRNSSSYLTPPGLLNKLRLPIVTMRGIALNLLLTLPFIILAVILTEILNEFLYPTFSNSQYYRVPLLIGLIITAFILCSYPFLMKWMKPDWKNRHRYDLFLTGGAALLVVIIILAQTIKLTGKFVNYSIEELPEHFRIDVVWKVLIVYLAVMLLLFLSKNKILTSIRTMMVRVFVGVLGPLTVLALYLLLCVRFIESPFIDVKYRLVLDGIQQVQTLEKADELTETRMYNDFHKMLERMNLIDKDYTGPAAGQPDLSRIVLSGVLGNIPAGSPLDESLKAFKKLGIRVEKTNHVPLIIPLTVNTIANKRMVVLSKRSYQLVSIVQGVSGTLIPPKYFYYPGLKVKMQDIKTINDGVYLQILYELYSAKKGEKFSQLKKAAVYEYFVEELGEKPTGISIPETGPESFQTLGNTWNVSIANRVKPVEIHGKERYMEIPEGYFWKGYLTEKTYLAWEGYLAWELYLAGLVILLLNIFFLDVNITSLHGFYRDRLSKAFLIRNDEKQKENSGMIHDDESDRLKLSELNQAGSEAPYHLVNTALNVPASKNPNLRGRDTDFFMFSKHYSGSRLTGYCRTKDLEEKAPHINLGTAMAISAAAASPSMGTMSIKTFTFIMTLLNVRLNYWVPNPNRKKFVKFTGPKYLLKEAIGAMNEESLKVNLSDGGHIENLGVYELLKRRCRLIIAVDGEADPDMKFKGLATLLRYAKIDMGIDIDIDIDNIRKDTNGISQQNWALGTVYYDEKSGEDGEQETGKLLYIKLSLKGDENLYIKNYRQKKKEFPHQSTADQFFDETQFEAYRALGKKIIDEMLEDPRLEKIFEGMD